MEYPLLSLIFSLDPKLPRKMSQKIFLRLRVLPHPLTANSPRLKWGAQLGIFEGAFLCKRCLESGDSHLHILLCAKWNKTDFFFQTAFV